ncbi:MAG: tail-specific protease, partial [Bacteroidota bacterium]|nr:tail-specific protease [Bacteroidota bacterium]
MKSRKGVVLLAIVLFGGLFFAFKNSGLVGSDILLTQRQRLLAAVGTALEEQHYSPKKIDDDFSSQVFTKFLNEMDGDKSHFLQSDIDQFNKYKFKLDDEIHGEAPVEFVPAVSRVFDQRIKDVMEIYKEILSKPFDFSKEETTVMDGAKLNFVATPAERVERWRKKLKYYTLERYVDLLDQKEKNKGKKDFVVKADTTLEREAREKVLKVMDDTYERIQKTYKED